MPSVHCGVKLLDIRADCAADIERELMSLKREEAKLIREIKQAAAKGNNAGAKQLAKSLVRLRGQEAKLQASVGQLRGVKTSITVHTTACHQLRSWL